MKPARLCTQPSPSAGGCPRISCMALPLADRQCAARGIGRVAGVKARRLRAANAPSALSGQTGIDARPAVRGSLSPHPALRPFPIPKREQSSAPSRLGASSSALQGGFPAAGGSFTSRCAACKASRTPSSWSLPSPKAFTSGCVWRSKFFRRGAKPPNPFEFRAFLCYDREKAQEASHDAEQTVYRPSPGPSGGALSRRLLPGPFRFFLVVPLLRRADGRLRSRSRRGIAGAERAGGGSPPL